MAVAIAIAFTLAHAPFAGAASFALPSSAGVGDQPSVAVDSRGDAYVAWIDNSQNVDQPPVQVCEIPAGQTACASEQRLATPNLQASLFQHVWVDIDANDVPVVVTSARNGAGAREIAYSSPDGGQSWEPTAFSPLGDVDPSSTAFDPALGNGVVFGLDTVNHNVITANAVDLSGVGGSSHDAALGQANASNSAAAVSDTASGIALADVWEAGYSPSTQGLSYSYYSGPALKGQPVTGVLGDVANSSHWTVGTLNDGLLGASLAGGPAGIFLSEVDGHADRVRQFTGGPGAFGPAAVANCGDATDPSFGAGLRDSNLVEDPVTGARQLVYIMNGAQEYIRYTELQGSTQSPPVTLAQSALTAGLPSVASDGPAHPGLAVWLQRTSTAPGSANTVWATWLPAVTLTGCPSRTPGAGGGAPPSHGGSPPPGSTAPTLRKTIKVANQQIVLSAPSRRSCQTRSSRLKLTLATTAIPGAHPRLRFRYARFYLDRGVRRTRTLKAGSKRRRIVFYTPNATASRLPVREALSLAHLRPGHHTLSVRLRFSGTVLRHHHRVTVTVERKLVLGISVC